MEEGLLERNKCPTCQNKDQREQSDGGGRTGYTDEGEVSTQGEKRKNSEYLLCEENQLF